MVPPQGAAAGRVRSHAGAATRRSRIYAGAAPARRGGACAACARGQQPPGARAGRCRRPRSCCGGDELRLLRRAVQRRRRRPEPAGAQAERHSCWDEKACDRHDGACCSGQGWDPSNGGAAGRWRQRGGGSAQTGDGSPSRVRGGAAAGTRAGCRRRAASGSGSGSGSGCPASGRRRRTGAGRCGRVCCAVHREGTGAASSEQGDCSCSHGAARSWRRRCCCDPCLRRPRDSDAPRGAGGRFRRSSREFRPWRWPACGPADATGGHWGCAQRSDRSKE